jgi:Tfp pilus assembly protein PilF
MPSTTRVTIACLLAFSIAPIGFAGGVDGRVVQAGSRTLANLMVELVGTGGAAQPPFRAYTDATGGFRYDDVPAGDYELRVTSQYGGDVIQRMFVGIPQESTRVTVDLPPRPTGAAGRPETVSAAALGHKPSRAASGAFQKADRLIARGEYADAITHLAAAIAADPLYTLAYVNLGACHASLGRYEEAAAPLRKAVALDPGMGSAHTNLSHVLLQLKQYEEAEAEARQALRLTPSSSKTHFLLGVILKLRGGHGEEALRELRTAEPDVPLAHIHAAQVLAQEGRSLEAAKEVKTYLSKAHPEKPEALRDWLARLKRDAQPR